MNWLSHIRARPWLLTLLVIGFVTGHLFLLPVLWKSVGPHIAIPSGVAAVVIVLVVAKHLGFVAALFRTLYGLFRRRYRN